MSHRKELQKLLKKAGYDLVRSKKHFVYKNETGNTIILPNHNKMNYNTYKSLKRELLAC